MSKKILSLALAVVMLVSVFTVAASAADEYGFSTESGEVGYRVVSDAYVNMPEGATVTVKVYYTFPDSLDLSTYKHTKGNTALCYTDAFECDTESRVWGSSYPMLKETALVSEAASVYSNISAAFSENDKAKGWTKAISVIQSFTSSSYNTQGYTIDPYCEIFSIEFTTTRELKETDSIGVAEGSITKKVTKCNYILNKKETAVASVNLNQAVADVDYLNIGGDSAFLLRNNAEDPNKLDVGVLATFKDAAFPVTFTGKTCNELKNIGIEARINGEVRNGLESSDLNYIYRNATKDGYDFVGAITKIPAADLDTKIEIRAYYIADGEPCYSDWVTVKAALRYQDGVDAGALSAIA